jgi:hypothetical protein
MYALALDDGARGALTSCSVQGLQGDGAHGFSAL